VSRKLGKHEREDFYGIEGSRDNQGSHLVLSPD
jgi:hypothetical protein